MARRGLSRFFSWRRPPGDGGEVEVEPGRTAPGRSVRVPSRDRLLEDSAQLAAVMFGPNLVRAPGWRSAPAYGVISEDLAAECARVLGDGQTVVSLLPGWAAGVADQIPAQYLVIEVAQLTSGPWAGVLEPGGEHLAGELLYLVENARSRFITPVLIDDAHCAADAPASFTVDDPLSRLRRAVPASVTDPLSPDPLAPPLSGLLEFLRRRALCDPLEGDS